MQTLSDATVIGLFETTPHLLTFGAAQGKGFLVHRLPLFTHEVLLSYHH
jgi:hypothetical protein